MRKATLALLMLFDHYRDRIAAASGNRPSRHFDRRCHPKCVLCRSTEPLCAVAHSERRFMRSSKVARSAQSQ